jgi:hypothetical protein
VVWLHAYSHLYQSFTLPSYQQRHQLSYQQRHQLSYRFQQFSAPTQSARQSSLRSLQSLSESCPAGFHIFDPYDLRSAKTSGKNPRRSLNR